MIKTSYNCGQQELYTVARLGWNSTTSHLAQFTAFKPKYIAAFITARLAEIDAAEALPDEEQRMDDSRTFRVQLKNSATEGLALWQKLKRYITDAYPKDLLEVKLDAAGQAHYRKAAQDEWASVKRLLNDGNTFITDNNADLTAGGNMPMTFAATFTAAKTDFDTLNDDFFSAEQGDEVETQTKILANNDVYAKLINMFLDGQEIYRTDEAVKKLFTFDQVLLTVTGPGIAGVRGLIKNGETNMPIGATATISLLNTDYTTTSNINSRYTLSPVAANTYTVIINAPGFQGIQVPNVIIQTGTIKTINAILNPAATQLTGIIKDSVTNLPLAGVEISEASLPTTVISAVDGSFHYPIDETGTYSFVAQKAGYDTVQDELENIDIDLGQTVTRNFQMTPTP